MKAFRTTDPILFQNKTMATLERDEAANSLMLGVNQRLIKTPAEFSSDPLMVWVEDAQGVTATALMTPPFRMILYCEPLQKISSLRLLVDILADTPLPGVLGKNYVAETFAGLWKDCHGGDTRINRQERIFKLTGLIPARFTTGYMRLATAEDTDQLIEWSSAFDLEALGGEELDFVEVHTCARIKNGDLFVWEDGLVTAMAAKVRPTHHGISIALVYTPPALRGRGYATALVSMLSQSLLDQGKQFCSLFTDLANPISNHIYQSIGYKPVCDFEEVLFTS